MWDVRIEILNKINLNIEAINSLLKNYTSEEKRLLLQKIQYASVFYDIPTKTLFSILQKGKVPDSFSQHKYTDLEGITRILLIQIKKNNQIQPK